jgi:hypothetical protein
VVSRHGGKEEGSKEKSEQKIETRISEGWKRRREGKEGKKRKE